MKPVAKHGDVEKLVEVLEELQRLDGEALERVQLFAERKLAEAHASVKMRNSHLTP